MKVWWIECTCHEYRWSRNRWGGTDSVPDLYKTEANANKQLTHGKIATGVSLRGSPYLPTWAKDCDYNARVIEGELNER